MAHLVVPPPPVTTCRGDGDVITSVSPAARKYQFRFVATYLLSYPDGLAGTTASTRTSANSASSRSRSQAASTESAVAAITSTRRRSPPTRSPRRRSEPAQRSASACHISRTSSNRPSRPRRWFSRYSRVVRHPSSSRSRRSTWRRTAPWRRCRRMLGVRRGMPSSCVIRSVGRKTRNRVSSLWTTCVRLCTTELAGAGRSGSIDAVRPDLPTALRCGDGTRRRGKGRGPQTAGSVPSRRTARVGRSGSACGTCTRSVDAAGWAGRLGG